MKILQLCKKFPYPLVDGESIAVNTLSRGLVENECEMHLLAMNTTKQYVEVDRSVSGLSHYTKIDFVKVDNRVTPLGALGNLFSRRSFHLSRFIVEEYRSQLAKILQKTDFDIVLIETMFLCPYIETIRKHSRAKVVLRSHNVEYKIWERVVEETKNPLKKMYLSYLTKKLKRDELHFLSEVDFIASVSQTDLNEFAKRGYKGPSCLSQIGLDMNAYKYASKHQFSKLLKIGFIGSLDWQPNLNGIKWFVKEVWPLVMNKKLNVELSVAGRNPPKDILDLDIESVNILGEVDSAIEFMNKQDILIVPLFSGSGIRVKILEAMALRKIVLTTTIGLEGIKAEDGKEIFIANDSIAFASKIETILSEESNLDQIQNAARIFVEQNFDYRVLAKQLIGKLRTL